MISRSAFPAPTLGNWSFFHVPDPPVSTIIFDCIALLSPTIRSPDSDK
ncbi:MAG: hypothetical protein K2N05_04055 [Muribaculaceae bacterium]|nr:hypothetical protein [Muribaculaceae bacterium]